MKLYLVQHGDAVSKEVDPERPLSEQGEADVARVASSLGRAKVRVPRVFHSGKTRAEQTAKMLADTIEPGAGPQLIAGIGPNDPTDAFLQQVKDWTEETMIVGHLPFMAKLVSRLVIGDDEPPLITYRPGSVVCVERSEDGRWSIAWMLRPELLDEA